MYEDLYRKKYKEFLHGKCQFGKSNGQRGRELVLEEEAGREMFMEA